MKEKNEFCSACEKRRPWADQKGKICIIACRAGNTFYHATFLSDGESRGHLSELVTCRLWVTEGFYSGDIVP